jgi:hypothetical protein
MTLGMIVAALGGVPLAFAAALVAAGTALAQEPAPEQAPQDPAEIVTEPAAPIVPRTMIGSWEFSNADREKICTITFREAGGARRVEFDPGCSKHFGFTRDIVGWSYADNDFLRLLDAQGQSLLEFSEVEGGIFEAPKAGEGILFIQNASVLGPAPKTAAEMAGEWAVSRRTGRPLCGLTLSNTAAGEEFVLRVQQPCDPLVARFAPATWAMDRGEIVLRSAGGQSWRFEEIETARWQRVPATANPLFLVRK